MKNVIIYCRVSSDEQKTNTSLDFQERKLREHCSAKGYNVIACYHEDFSAKHHDFQRPEMKKIRDYCKKHKHEVDLILFLRWDRFSRNPEFAYMFKRMFLDDWGIEFNALESPIDFSATEWSSLLSSYCAAAHTENNKISRRTRDGIRETLLSGRWAGVAPRGYKNVHIVNQNGITVSKSVEVDEETAPTIKKIFQEVGKGLECPAVIRKRIAPNIPVSSFFEILRNIFYKGKIRVPATKTDPEIIVDGIHESLVTEELFNRVQEVIDGKRKKQPKLTKTVKPEFYLRKFLVCPHCGRSITGAFSTGSSGGKYPYYFCPTTGKHLRMPADEVNNKFIEYIFKLRPNNAIMQMYSETLDTLRKDEMRAIDIELQKLRAEEQDIEERMNKIEDMYLDRELSKEEFDRMINRQKKQKKMIQDKMQLLRTPNRTKIEPQLRYAINLIDNIDRFFQVAAAEDKIRVLSSIFSGKIEFDGKNFRTENFNNVLGLIYQQSNELVEIKKAESPKTIENSALVPPSRIELLSKV